MNLPIKVLKSAILTDEAINKHQYISKKYYKFQDKMVLNKKQTNTMNNDIELTLNSYKKEEIINW